MNIIECLQGLKVEGVIPPQGLRFTLEDIKPQKDHFYSATLYAFPKGKKILVGEIGRNKAGDRLVGGVLIPSLYLKEDSPKEGKPFFNKNLKAIRNFLLSKDAELLPNFKGIPKAYTIEFNYLSDPSKFTVFEFDILLDGWSVIRGTYNKTTDKITYNTKKSLNTAFLAHSKVPIIVKAKRKDFNEMVLNKLKGLGWDKL